MFKLIHQEMIESGSTSIFITLCLTKILKNEKLLQLANMLHLHP